MDSEDSALFLDQTFKLYKSNRAPGTLSESQIKYLQNNLSKYLYTQYANTTRNDEIIPRYSSAKDVLQKLQVTSGEKTGSKYHIQYLIIRCGTLLQRQSLVFVTDPSQDIDTYNTILLMRTGATVNPVETYVISLLENLIELDIPLVIREHRLQHSHILTITNSLFTNLLPYTESRTPGTETRVFEHLVGNVEITYSTPEKSINSNLRNITVSVPNADMAKFGDKVASDGTIPLVSEIQAFLRNSTTMNLGALSIVKFSSSLISISIDGRLRISGEKVPENLKESVVWSVLESVYNE